MCVPDCRRVHRPGGAVVAIVAKLIAIIRFANWIRMETETWRPRMQNRRPILLSIVFTIIAIFRAPAFSATTTATPIAPLPAGAVRVIGAPGFGHVAVVVNANAESFIVLDGHELPHYDSLGDDQIAFSADAMHFAYEATKGAVTRIVVDGQEWPAFDQVTMPVFALDGRVGYGAQKDKQWTVSIAGKPIVQCDHIADGMPIFSADAKHFAIEVEIGNKWNINLDGTPGPGFDTITNVTFSPNGSRLAYIAEDAGKTHVIIDGKDEPQPDGIRKNSFVFSPDGKHYGYTANVGEKQAVFIDGQKKTAYDGAAPPVFSRDGAHIAYAAAKGKKQVMVIDGVESPEYDSAAMPVFSPDGSRLAYTAIKDHQNFVVLDGKPGPGYDDIGFNAMVFSPDNLHFAYGAKKANHWVLVSDGAEVGTFDAIAEGSPMYSPDSKHLAASVRIGAKRLVIVDNQPGPEYDLILRGGPIFQPDGSLAFLAINKNMISRIVCQP
jgi:Tol biopolymer transport system component